MKRASWGVALGTGCALMVAACGSGVEEDPLPGDQTVTMRISLAGDACGVVAATATVTAPDFPPIGPESLYVWNGYIEGYVNPVPVGRQRLVDVRAYNRDGQEVYAGSTAVDVYEGEVSYAQIRLLRNAELCPGGMGSIYLTGVLENGTGSSDGGPVYDAGPGPSFDAGTVSDGGAAFDAG
ncbi:hypothetical protein [Corallococcus silvisoli]|uniref:hypothetical protein n=1 Tax=Corallococcus silvisoli TaxID=2697031 RepID=UPI00137713DF|nr:hypothetical protein [Corallococcus silvisoli]NBD12408.1 hypothetical protein [Corallococcus silvisoli]